MIDSGCALCSGTGFLTETKDGALFARPCSCTRRIREERLFHESGILQKHHQRFHFANYKPANPSQRDALMRARSYAEEYPVLPETHNGLLFMGPCGVGKTHLAVSILLDILQKKKIPVLFANLNALYCEIRATYGKQEGENEYDIMRPLVEAPLLCLDELGCLASPWAQDTLYFLVNQRYSEQKPTLFTTNYPDSPARGEPSLEERIGTRTRSRIAEMCQLLLVEGEDYRRIIR